MRKVRRFTIFLSLFCSLFCSHICLSASFTALGWELNQMLPGIRVMKTVLPRLASRVAYDPPSTVGDYTAFANKAWLHHPLLLQGGGVVLVGGWGPFAILNEGSATLTIFRGPEDWWGPAMASRFLTRWDVDILVKESINLARACNHYQNDRMQKSMREEEIIRPFQEELDVWTDILRIQKSPSHQPQCVLQPNSRTLEYFARTRYGSSLVENVRWYLNNGQINFLPYATHQAISGRVNVLQGDISQRRTNFEETMNSRNPNPRNFPTPRNVEELKSLYPQEYPSLLDVHLPSKTSLQFPCNQQITLPPGSWMVSQRAPKAGLLGVYGNGALVKVPSHAILGGEFTSR